MVLRGRATSPIRPGLFIRSHLLHVGEDHPSQIHRHLKDEYARENKRRRKGERLRPPTFHSFLRYFHQLRAFSLLEFTGREEPMSPDAPPSLLQMRDAETPEVVEGVVRYYRLTDKGKAEPPHEAFFNPIGVWLKKGYEA